MADTLTIGEVARRAGVATSALLASGRDWTSLARTKRAELEGRLRALEEARALIDQALACGCADLEGCSAAHEGARPA